MSGLVSSSSALPPYKLGPVSANFASVREFGEERGRVLQIAVLATFGE